MEIWKQSGGGGKRVSALLAVSRGGAPTSSYHTTGVLRKLGRNPHYVLPTPHFPTSWNVIPLIVLHLVRLFKEENYKIIFYWEKRKKKILRHIYILWTSKKVYDFVFLTCVCYNQLWYLVCTSNAFVKLKFTAISLFWGRLISLSALP